VCSMGGGGGGVGGGDSDWMAQCLMGDVEGLYDASASILTSSRCCGVSERDRRSDHSMRDTAALKLEGRARRAMDCGCCCCSCCCCSLGWGC
jgi:hypothetical protein